MYYVNNELYSKYIILNKQSSNLQNKKYNKNYDDKCSN